MRVLYFHQYFTTPKGVGGNRSYWLAKALVKAGHEVHMVCANSPNGDTGVHTPFQQSRRQGTIDGIRVTEFELNYSNQLGLLKRTAIFLRYAMYSVKMAMTEDYDLIFCSSTPLTAGIPGIVSRWIRRKRFVFEIRDLWPELPRAMGVISNPLVLGAMSILEWTSYRSAHACIGLSPGIVKGIKKRSRPNAVTAMLPNGCDLSVFNESPEDLPNIDGILPTDFVAIFIGAHGMANGLDAVLDTAAQLKKQQVTHIKLLLLGNGKMKSSLLRRKESEQLDNCVFLPPVPKDQLNAFMQRADAGLMVLKNVPAFYYGTSPNKFFDYITAGKPVINNYPGWLADIITKYNLGIAIPADSPQLFADALIRLSQNAEQTKTMGENARELARSEFNRETIGLAFVKFLEEQYCAIGK